MAKLSAIDKILIKVGLRDDDRQPFLFFTSNRRIIEDMMQTEFGYAVDDDNCRAWELSNDLVYNFEDRPTVLAIEERSTLLDLSNDSLIPAEKVTLLRMRKIGADAVASILLNITRDYKREGPAKMILWIALLFAFGIMMLVIVMMIQSGMVG